MENIYHGPGYQYVITDTGSVVRTGGPASSFWHARTILLSHRHISWGAVPHEEYKSADHYK
ncbi:MAG TPA: hypothetical protein ENH59_03435 [Bacteroidetes bacterium]|nr:hypothetical protein [Bacteroidota bacterium]